MKDRKNKTKISQYTIENNKIMKVIRTKDELSNDTTNKKM